MARRKARPKKIGSYLLWAVLFIAIILLTSSFVPVWKIQNIEIRGNHLLEKELIKDLSKTALDQNIFFVNLGGISDKIKKLSLIRDVRIHRFLPGTLIVNVFERVPAAVAVIEGKTIIFDQEGYTLNPDGRQFLGEGLTDLPVVVGLKNSDIKENKLAQSQRELLEAVLRDFKKYISADRIKIDLRLNDEIVLLVDDFLSVKIGNPQNIDKKLSAFQKLKNFEQKRLQQVEYIDVRLPENSVIKFK